jgi:hypothetical protein
MHHRGRNAPSSADFTPVRPWVPITIWLAPRSREHDPCVREERHRLRRLVDGQDDRVEGVDIGGAAAGSSSSAIDRSTPAVRVSMSLELS